MESEGKFPPLKWAQNAEAVFITVDVIDAQDIVVDVNEETSTIVFSAMSGSNKYAMKVDTFRPISKEQSKWNLKGRNVLLYIAKKEVEEDS